MGQGIALAPRLLLNAEQAQGRLDELWRDAPRSQDGFYVSCPDDRSSNPARDAVIDQVFSEAASTGARQQT